MKWINREAAAEKMREVLDEMTKAYTIMLNGFSIDCEQEEPLAEWTEEEKNNGEGYLHIHNISLFDHNSIHMNRIEEIHDLLGLPYYSKPFNGERGSKEVWVEYKGFILFCIRDMDEYEKLDVPAENEFAE